MKTVLTLFVWLVLSCAAAHGQWVNYPEPATPRARDGKPNLNAPAPRAHLSCAKMKSEMMWNEMVLTPQPFPVCIRGEGHQVLESPPRDSGSEYNAA